MPTKSWDGEDNDNGTYQTYFSHTQYKSTRPPLVWSRDNSELSTDIPRGTLAITRARALDCRKCPNHTAPLFALISVGKWEKNEDRCINALMPLERFLLTTVTTLSSICLIKTLSTGLPWWSKIRLPMSRKWVPSLVWRRPHRHGATKPVCTPARSLWT